MKIKRNNHVLEGRRILIAVTGSIAAVKTPLLVSSLIKSGAKVRCLITPSASNLISPLALATLSRHRCYQDEDQWNPSEPRPLHIALAEWAEIVVIAPLSASTIAKWSQGIADGLLASLLLACERPVIAAAAMNTAMWEKRPVQNNWAKIQTDPRVLTLAPETGLLACDRIGEGRMADPELIELAIINGLLQKDINGKLQTDWSNKRLLITAGPTYEALDPARLITNRSSGRMGVLIAQAARFRGATVDLVHGPLQLPTGWLQGLQTHPINNAEEMQSKLSELQKYANALVMAAAVADVRRKDGGSQNKISKADLLLTLQDNFEQVPDLLQQLVINRHSGQSFLAFAALTGTDLEIKEQGEEKRLNKGCDLLMANPIDRPGQGFSDAPNGGWLLGPKRKITPIPITSKFELAHQLLNALLLHQKEIALTSQPNVSNQSSDDLASKPC